MQARTNNATGPRSRFGLVAGAATLAILCMDPASARADRRTGSGGGALGQATRAVSQSVSSPSPAQPSNGSSGPSYEPDRYTNVYYEPDYRRPYPYAGAYCSTCGPAGRAQAHSGQPGPREPVRVAVHLGLQSVEDSDGATMGSLRVTKGMLGAAIAGTHYYEDGLAMDGTNTIYMNVWSLSAMARVLHTGATELWVSGGLGETSSNQFETLSGPAVGAEIEHTFTPSLRVSGSARYYVLEQDMRASELRAAVGASFLSVGYRVFSFNVGPALRGPEVGVALRF